MENISLSFCCCWKVGFSDCFCVDFKNYLACHILEMAGHGNVAEETYCWSITKLCFYMKFILWLIIVFSSLLKLNTNLFCFVTKLWLPLLLWSMDTSRTSCVAVSDTRRCRALLWHLSDTCRKTKIGVLSKIVFYLIRHSYDRCPTHI